MTNMMTGMDGFPCLPEWVPKGAQRYLAHTEAGLPIRELARRSGSHASTILRQIRRVETQRDDPLVDAALRKLGASHFTQDEITGAASLRGPSKTARHAATLTQKDSNMSFQSVVPHKSTDDSLWAQDATRILRRMCEKGAVLAVAADMEKAVVVRDTEDGASTRTAVVDRDVAQAMALKEWISADTTGRITRYQITAAGRTALTEMLEQSGDTAPNGFAEAQADFGEQHRTWGEKTLPDADTGRSRKMRYNLSESPLTALARRRDKQGERFLSDALVTAGERLREDFELAQMGPRVAQNWDRFLTGGGRGGFAADSGVGNGPAGARNRVAAALTDLGPGLSDVVLRCCCYLEGLETAEKKLGWSARSGKIVLRIALMRLQRHYEETTGPGGGLIG